MAATARIAAAAQIGPCIYQVVPMCIPSNTRVLLGPTRVYSSNDNSIGSAVLQNSRS